MDNQQHSKQAVQVLASYSTFDPIVSSLRGIELATEIRRVVSRINDLEENIATSAKTDDTKIMFQNVEELYHLKSPEWIDRIDKLMYDESIINDAVQSIKTVFDFQTTNHTTRTKVKGGTYMVFSNVSHQAPFIMDFKDIETGLVNSYMIRSIGIVKLAVGEYSLTMAIPTNVSTTVWLVQ